MGLVEKLNKVWSKKINAGDRVPILLELKGEPPNPFMIMNRVGDLRESGDLVIAILIKEGRFWFINNINLNILWFLTFIFSYLYQLQFFFFKFQTVFRNQEATKPTMTTASSGKNSIEIEILRLSIIIPASILVIISNFEYCCSRWFDNSN